MNRDEWFKYKAREDEKLHGDNHRAIQAIIYPPAPLKDGVSSDILLRKGGTTDDDFVEKLINLERSL